MKKQFAKLTVFVLLIFLPLAGYAEGGKISGTIEYLGDQNGKIIFAALAIPPDMNEPLLIDSLDAPGAYEISDLADGTYFLAAFMDVNGDEFPGFDEPLGLYPAPVLLQDSVHISDINFSISELPRGGGSITGEVSYTGALTGDVYVYALGFSKTPFTETHFDWGQTSSFNVDGLFGGDYLLVAFMDVDGNQMPDPGEPMGSAESVINLDDGEIYIGADITLFDPSMYTGSISGTTLYTGFRTGETHVMAVGLSLTPISDVIADPATGDFSIPDLAAGDYYLFAYLDEDSSGSYDLGESFSETYLDPVSLDWGDDTSGVVVDLVDRGTGAIAGNITYTGDEDGHIILAAVGPSATPFVPSFAIRFGPGPYPYIVPGLAPGLYTVAGVINSQGMDLPSTIEEFLAMPFGFYLEDFVFVDQDTIEDINFTLEDTTTSIMAGTITAPEGASGEVHLFALGLSKTPFTEFSIPDAGDYEITGLGAGKYILAAFMDVNGDSAYNLDEPVGFTTQLKTVHSDTREENINLTLSSLPITDVDQLADATKPRDFALLPNYPNPFNPTTTLRYQVPIESRVSIKIYNLLGKEIATLVNEVVQAGTHQLVWDANSITDQELSSGIYICRMETGRYVKSRKMMLVR